MSHIKVESDNLECWLIGGYIMRFEYTVLYWIVTKWFSSYSSILSLHQLCYLEFLDLMILSKTLTAYKPSLHSRIVVPHLLRHKCNCILRLNILVCSKHHWSKHHRQGIGRHLVTVSMHGNTETNYQHIKYKNLKLFSFQFTAKKWTCIIYLQKYIDSIVS